VTVTNPVEFSANNKVVGFTLISAVGTGVTVTTTLTVFVLLPVIGMIVGPSGVAAVNVIVQLAPIARVAAQVVLCTLMPLPPGIVAAMLLAVSVDWALFVTVTTPLLPAVKPSTSGLADHYYLQ